MGENDQLKKNHHGFFDAVSGLFGAERKPLPASPADGSFTEVQNSFNNALRQLNEKIELLRHETAQELPGKESVETLAQAKQRRTERVHTAICEDILAMHLRLGTGIDRPALEKLAALLRECGEMTAQGKLSQEVMPRCRASILGRLHREAGSLAWAELEQRLATCNVAWTETTLRDPLDSDDEFERLRRLKYREIQEGFIDDDLLRSSRLILGIESAWQSDYPERDTPLWRELVLEGVATALRARIFGAFYERLLQNRDLILTKATELVGQELDGLNQTLGKAVTTLEDAHRVAISSYRVIDEVIPDVAWQVVREPTSAAGIPGRAQPGDCFTTPKG